MLTLWLLSEYLSVTIHQMVIAISTTRNIPTIVLGLARVHDLSIYSSWDNHNAQAFIWHRGAGVPCH